VYRRYAGLFFSIGVDASDNELTTLEAIHLFVEILDHFFSNVCELDLVFNFHKVRCFAGGWGRAGSSGVGARGWVFCLSVGLSKGGRGERFVVPLIPPVVRRSPIPSLPASPPHPLTPTPPPSP